MKVLKHLYIVLIFLGLLGVSSVFTQNALAQSGCCSWHGGESYCDSSTGRWVCNDGTYSPTCTCGGGYYQAPAYVPPPTCPLNSYYDGSSCKCYSGYVSNGSYCISNQQNCWNTYGYNSTYDYGSGSCTCSNGYVMSGGTCISGNSYCWNNYGYNSQYDSLTNKCKCAYGYVWNNSGDSCISEDESCHNQLGIMSQYNSVDNTCDCLSGYTIQGGQCLPEPKRIVIPRINNADNTNNTKTIKSTYKSNVATPTPIPTITIKPSLSIKPYALPSSQKTFIDRIIDFLKSIF